MKRQISKKDYTIKSEIVLNKITKSQSFKILQSSDDYNIEQQRGLTRRKSCYSLVFGQMNKFQIRYHNILPEFKTKQFTQDKETKETYRRQTQIAEDTVIRKFRRGLQEFTKCNTVIQTLKMLKKKKNNIQNFIEQISSPNNRIILENTRRNSCLCSECGQQAQFQKKHQNDPFFKYFNYSEFVKRQIIKRDPNHNRFRNKLFSQIQQEHSKKCFVSENKSQINKYKTVSRTTNLLLKISSTKIIRNNLMSSQRVKTDFSQCSPKSFQFISNNNASMKSRKLLNQQNFNSITSNQTKDSFRSLASIYR